VQCWTCLIRVTALSVIQYKGGCNLLLMKTGRALKEEYEMSHEAESKRFLTLKT
jgi:hypothetical protein